MSGAAGDNVVDQEVTDLPGGGEGDPGENENQDNANGNQVNYLEMSDQDILKMGTPTFEKPKVDETKPDVVVEDKTPKAGKVDGVDEGGDSKPEEKPNAAADKAKLEEGKDKVEADPTDKTKKPAADEKQPEKKVDEAKDKPEEKKAEKSEGVIDYKAEYERLLAPFRANGREIKVDSVDDAISLMQMGANYNKQMAAFKPYRKLMKMLENNGFLSEEKIGYLIDLGKKDPGAINKLVKEAGINPMDLDADKASAYKQNTYAVDDREIELDTVLDEVKDSSTYTRLLDVVSNKWDDPSKRIVSEQPQLLKVINDHMASGVYDRISAEMEKERLFGRLKGMSDLEAYKHVGDSMNARGAFNDLFQAKPDQSQSKPKDGDIVQPKAKPTEDDKLNEKRRAASPTKPAAPASGGAKEIPDPLSMSDEEFSKLSITKFIKA